MIWFLLGICLICLALTAELSWLVHQVIARFESNFIPISFDVIMSDEEEDRKTDPSVNEGLQ